MKRIVVKVGTSLLVMGVLASSIQMTASAEGQRSGGRDTRTQEQPGDMGAGNFNDTNPERDRNSQKNEELQIMEQNRVEEPSGDTFMIQERQQKKIKLPLDVSAIEEAIAALDDVDQQAALTELLITYTEAVEALEAGIKDEDITEEQMTILRDAVRDAKASLLEALVAADIEPTTFVEIEMEKLFSVVSFSDCLRCIQ